MKLARGLATKTTALAISSGVPKRFSATGDNGGFFCKTIHKCSFFILQICSSKQSATLKEGANLKRGIH